MERCFKCGKSSEEIRLFDAISKEGIIKICERCSHEEKTPLIRKPFFQSEESEKEQFAHNRFFNPQKQNPIKQEQETTLREIVERNFENKISEKQESMKGLIDNFHWVVMRARRMKKITQQQLAKEIMESESAIKMAEKGVVPEGDFKLINKLERYLGIKIVKPEFVEEIRQEEKPKNLSFDLNESKSLTIEDLRKMKEVKEECVEEPELVNEEIKETKSEEAKSINDSGEISKEEMDRILFGK